MDNSGPNVESSSCTYKMSSNDAADLSDKDPARNPITGMGLNGDGVGGLKPKIPKSRMGNPVTGEGYRPGLTDYEEMGQRHRRLGESKTDRY